ncbi:MAG: RiPP maturation radical SAM C-methyltransferase, partial [Candidatus Xenobia bacterium]
HICLGEGDAAFPELVRKLRAGDLGMGVKGMLSRVGNTILDPGPATTFVDMNALPDPDYDEYFSRYQTLPEDQKAEAFGGKTTGLIIETARGCWWGHKHHCTFCGLPGLGMKFRSRSIPKVLDQLERMAKRYNTWLFYAVDNIMDPAYVDGLFGYLAEHGYDYQLMYESKANLTVDKL